METGSKRALITGITGQDGSYLAELLLEKGYEVLGTMRKSEGADALWRIAPFAGRLSLIVTDYSDIGEIAAAARPDELYHLAAESRVDESFWKEMSTFQFNIATTELILRGLRKDSPGTRFYFAASSEMFGPTSGRPQNETSPLNPVSPYAVSKVAGFYLTRMYREAYGLHASSGIAFNHESPRRGASFVTRKIAHAAAAISLGRAKELRLGNLEVRRDWGFAGDYVDAMWRMLQKEQAADYVIGTGRNHALTEFLDLAFGHVGLDWHEHVVSDPELLRPLDIPVTLADPAKAGRELGWEPRASFEELIAMMVDAELERLSS